MTPAGPRLVPGDHVVVPYGPRPLPARVIEDRGYLANGEQLVAVRLLGSGEEFELPASALGSGESWRILVPQFAQSSTGLWLPMEGAAVTTPDGRDRLFDAVRMAEIKEPSWRDQVATYVTVEELGITAPSREAVADSLAQLPFTRTMMALAHLHREVGRAGADLVAQRRLLDRLIPGTPEFKRRILAHVSASDNVQIFSEQALFVIQRLTIEFAHEEESDVGPEEEASFASLIFGVPATYLDPDPDELADEASATDVLARFVASGGLFDSDWFGAAIGRAFALYTIIARRPDAREHPQYCDVNDWLREAYDLDVEELQAGGFAIAAQSGLFADEEEAGPLWVLPSALSSTAMRDRFSTLADALGGSRSWYRSEFEKSGDPRFVARDFRPFFQRPMLRRAEDDALLPLSPRAVKVALGDKGLFYRLLDLARDRSDATRQRFANFHGWLYEQYAVMLATQAFETGGSPHRPVRVVTETEYKLGKRRIKTPDIVLDCAGLDLVVIEVTGGRLTTRSIIEGDVGKVADDLHKVIVSKIGQLGDRVAEMDSEPLILQRLRATDVKRIWPVLLYADPVFLSAPFWMHVERFNIGRPTSPRVQPLTLLDMAEFERFMSLSLHTWPISILEAKTADTWATRDFSSWLTEDPNAPVRDGVPELPSRLWGSAVQSAARVLFPEQARTGPGPLD